MRTSILTFIVLYFLIHIAACKKEDLATCEVKGTITSSSTKAEDQLLLSSLYENISLQAQNASCNGSEQWGITPIGSKPCGGAAGYMVYNQSIDTTCFLQMVKQYSLLSAQFNTKYQVMSDCAVMAFPIKVTCENGKLVLGY